MNTDLEPRLKDWFASTAPSHEPVDLVDRVSAIPRTSAIGRRGGVPGLFRRRMAVSQPARVAIIAMSLAALLAALLAAFALVGSTSRSEPSYTGTFTTTGSMGTARTGHTATLLLDGRVLVVGGRDDVSSAATATAEIYDPRTSAFSRTGSMSTPRSGHAAARLPDGRLLVFGGADQLSAEVFDPRSGTFTPVDPPTLACPECESTEGVSSIVLPDGRVLLIGLGPGGPGRAQIYDPGSGTFRALDLDDPGAYSSMSLLADGQKALVIGGDASVLGDVATATAASILDTDSDTVMSLEPLRGASLMPLEGGLEDGAVRARRGVSQVPLASGEMLVIGGWAKTSGPYPIDEADLYDPASGRFLPTGSLLTPRVGPSVTLLSDGRVLVAGGDTWDGSSRGGKVPFEPSTDLAELYEPDSARFVPTGSMTVPRSGATVTRLDDGAVLVIGGVRHRGLDGGLPETLRSAELYR